MKQTKVLSNSSVVILLKTLKNGLLAVIDINNSLRIINPVSHATVAGYKANIQYNYINSAYVDISFCGKYSLSIIPETNQAALFDVPNKTFLTKVGEHQGELECVAMDPTGRYCITCGQDGKGFIWINKTGRLAFATPRHPDYISAACFNASGQWIATGSYDCNINIFSTSSTRTTLKLKGHSSAVVKLIFLSDTLLISADSNGEIIVWNFRRGIIHKRLTKIDGFIVSMVLSNNGNFLYIGTRSGSVALCDLYTMTLIGHHFLSIKEKITSIALVEESSQLAIATEDGNIHFFLLFKEEEHYAKMISENRYGDFYMAVENNPLLKYSKYYEICEQIWSDTLTKAHQYLKKEDDAGAKEILEAFINVSAKKTQIAQLLKHHDKYTLLNAHFEDKRYAFAYALARQFQMLQSTEAYKQMEADWSTSYAKAESYITSPEGSEQIYAVMSPYKGIPEKTQSIKELFDKHRIYVHFKKNLNERNYFKIFHIASLQPFIKELNEYKIVVNFADKLYVQAQLAYKSGDLFKAKRKYEILLEFPDYSEEAKKLLTIIRNKPL